MVDALGGGRISEGIGEDRERGGRRKERREGRGREGRGEREKEGDNKVTSRAQYNRET